MTVCSFLGCGRAAVPGHRPVLCADHVDRTICPSCEWWSWSRRGRTLCGVCGGATYCTLPVAQEAIRLYRRWEDYERREVPLELRDARWLGSPRFGLYTGRSSGDPMPPEPPMPFPDAERALWGDEDDDCGDPPTRVSIASPRGGGR